jgi:hypothetical protein
MLSGMKWRPLALLVCCFLWSGCVMHLVDRMTGEDQANLIRKSGTPAFARVLDLRDTGMTLNENPIVSMHVEVHADGVAPFEATMKALVGRLDIPLIQPGAMLPVRYDPNDHARVALDLYEGRK